MDDNEVLELMKKEYEEAKKATNYLTTTIANGALERIIKKALERAGLDD